MRVLKPPLRDAQDDAPAYYCCKCGGEVYSGKWGKDSPWTGLCEECNKNADDK